MTTSPGPVEATHRPDPVQAVATFFREDPARILAVASHLRDPGRTVESTVAGMSMGRTLPPGTRIRIDLGGPAAGAVGDVVTFVAGSQVVVHRVIARGWGAGRGFLVTRGDIALAPDRPVREDTVLGAVTGVWEGGAWVAPPGAPRGSRRARAARAGCLWAVTVLLTVSPRAAQGLAAVLQRLEKVVREAIWDTRPGRPSGPATSGAA
jgi:hypothetical protein